MTPRRNSTGSRLEKLTRKFLHAAGMDWQAIADASSEIVVFGSCAAGVETPASDLDLLVVAEPSVRESFRHSTRLDIVFRTTEEVLSPDWLHSELAGHIATYGHWLRGSGAWRAMALESLGRNATAIDHKQARIERLTRSLRLHWPRLTPEFRNRNLITLRRERQRLTLLQSGMAVPPTRLLDAEAWSADTALEIAPPSP